MAATHAAMGNHDDALASYRNALHEARQVTDRTGEARAHHGIGNTLADRDPAAAREHLLAALALYEDMELPERHAVSEKLAGLTGS
jgi:tetratricopeptide (TPR) repeat protein